MKCLTCGQELEEGMSFCFRCGAAVTGETKDEAEEEKKEEASDDTLPGTDGERTEENEERPAEDAPDAERADEDLTEEKMEEEKASAPAEENAEKAAETVSSGDNEEAPSEAVPEEETESGLPARETGGPYVPTPLPLTRLRTAAEENRNAADAAGPDGRGQGKAVTLRDLRERLMDVGGSGTMLFFCILSTLQMALSLLAGAVSCVTTVAAVIRTGGKVSFGGAAPIPSLIVVAWLVLFWALYAKCRKRSETGYTGILIALRVFMIVNAVTAAFCAALFVLGAVLYSLLPAGLLFASSLGSVPPEGFPAWILFAAVPILFLCCAAYVLLAVYYGKAAVFFRDVNSVVSEKVRPIRAGFLRFFCWMQIALGAVAAIGSAALIGSGKGLVRLLASIPTLSLPSDVASRIVTAVAVVAAVSAVSSLVSAVSFFARERLYKAASDVTGGLFGVRKA